MVSSEAAQWGVYILRCRDGSMYTGMTNRLPARLACHLAGKGSRYTRSRLPVELVYWEVLTDRSQALKREYAIKSLTRAQKLALLDHYLAQSDLDECTLPMGLAVSCQA